MNRRSTLLPEHPPMELTLPNFLREYGEMASQCAAERVDHPGTCPGWWNWNSLTATSALWSAESTTVCFPAVKSLDTFDFPAFPSVNRALVMELARCEYVNAVRTSSPFVDSALRTEYRGPES